MKTVKIKKLFTGIVLTGIVTGKKVKVFKEDGETLDHEVDEVVERYVKPGEVVTVLDYVPAKLDALKESYEVVKDSDVSTKPAETKHDALKPADKKNYGDKP